MLTKASIFRIDLDAQTALSDLSKLLGRPMNKLVNEAVKDYLRKTSLKERELEATLASLRAYRAREGHEEAHEGHLPEGGGHATVANFATAREFVRRISVRYLVKAAMLFGSRARGTHRADSDMDIAVLLRGARGNRMDTSLEMANIAFDLLLETNVYITPLPIWEDEWEHPETHSNPHLLENIRREGVLV